MGINTTSTLLMIRPINFRYNEQTAVNNYYQNKPTDEGEVDFQTKALAEFDDFVEKLEAKGIEVVVVNDTLKPETPDSIFPNNWVSFHHDGTVGLYPMYAENRRLERREDIFDLLEDKGFEITQEIHLTEFEEVGKFLEGTGSLILDRENKIAYAALSQRTDPDVLDTFNEQFGFRIVEFVANQTHNGQRLPIYHTNVMMCLGDEFAVICLDAIDDMDDRDRVIESLEDSDKEIIEITEEQKECFAGNMLQVENKEGEKFIVMSDTAYNSLDQDQIDRLLTYNKEIIHSSLHTIETLGGGSARCMMAEVFLPKSTDT
ncbi:arginine deiminase-related protein [Reichenbachiella agarivorans]|uniref:Arginine deiminase-related protein n=1 Tax=Reichenbachiella agarivorans TaxID=2979464 RepID=A0ABY6CU54_9BACT|nr:arginine deiminase-related protein [Reichenbachiella agarivorans]UXP34059.1 arginine deiminase-related protein [Reichenbachiella agarivorans]